MQIDSLSHWVCDAAAIVRHAIDPSPSPEPKVHLVLLGSVLTPESGLLQFPASVTALWVPLNIR